MLRPRRWHRSTAGSPHQPHGAASEQTPIGPAKVEEPDRRACIMTPLRRSTPCGALAPEKACPVPSAKRAHGAQVRNPKEHPMSKTIVAGLSALFITASSLAYAQVPTGPAQSSGPTQAAPAQERLSD